MQDSRREAWAGRSSVAIAAGTLVALLALGAPGRAAAQDVDFKGALQRKYDILQQQADSDRIRAEAERTRAEAERARMAGEAVRAKGQTGIARQVASERYIVASGGDDFAGTNVPIYRLPNGVTMRVSDGFRPGEGAICIAYCPKRPK